MEEITVKDIIKETQETIKLAKDCNEAIKKLYFDSTHKQNEYRGRYPLDCKWEWEPEVGEQFIGSEGIPIVIAGIIDVPLVFGTENRRLRYLSMSKVKEVFVKDVTPLLHWEKILRILKNLGYSIFVETQFYNCRATISRNGVEITRKIGEDSQSAVMQAVIKAAKEIK